MKQTNEISNIVPSVKTPVVTNMLPARAIQTSYFRSPFILTRLHFLSVQDMVMTVGTLEYRVISVIEVIRSRYTGSYNCNRCWINTMDDDSYVNVRKRVNLKPRNFIVYDI